jgi:uncharacterized protein DUF6010
MTDAELIPAMLFEGAILGLGLSLLAFVLSRSINDVFGRTALGTGLFAAAGAYFGFAIVSEVSRIWIFIELFQVIVFGALGLHGWRGSPKWLALGWALHPLWDFVLHYLGPGRAFAPLAYSISCVTFDWVVAAYILIYYRGANLRARNPAR